MVKRILAMLVLLVLPASIGCGSGGAEKFLREGAAHFQKHEYDLAIKSYEKAISLEPKSAVAYNMLGMAYRFEYLQLGNPDLRVKEVEAFKKAIEIDPNFWGAMLNLGATYYYTGQKDKAAPLFKKALVLNPNNPEKEQLEKMIAEGEEKK